MNVLVVGSNSYIAKAFIRTYQTAFNLTLLRRGASLPSYFDLLPEHFADMDAVINFSAIVHQKSPDRELSGRINTQLPVFLANMAKQTGVKQFIQLSTIAVYGSHAVSIDSGSLLHPDTLYGQTKAAADEALEKLADETFTVTIVRPPIVYGKGAPGNMQGLVRLIRTVPLLPFAYGGNCRSVLYIDNLLKALSLMLSKRAGGVFLVRDKEMPSLERLCQIISKELDARTHFFSPPAVLIAWLMHFKHFPFYKLYGDLKIDDGETRKRLGDYAAVSLEVALAETVGRH